MVKVQVPAMYPFPAVTFEGKLETVRVLAIVLTSVAKNKDTNYLCGQVPHHYVKIYGDLGCKAKQVCDLFCNAVADALGDCAFATTWARKTHGLEDPEVAAAYRPAWAAHMARSIYEQIGA